MRCAFLLLATTALVASAKRIVITVGGNTTQDPTLVFQPNQVKADEGDVVFFNFTQGNHTVTQSSFAAPCTWLAYTDPTKNGFDSSFRNAGNSTPGAITSLEVPITNPNISIFFFDWNTCARGGVGIINVNETSLEVLAGFQRNAIRLNGTGAGGAASSASRASSAPTSSATSIVDNPDSAANRVLVNAASVVLPALVLLAALSF